MHIIKLVMKSLLLLGMRTSGLLCNKEQCPYHQRFRLFNPDRNRNYGFLGVLEFHKMRLQFKLESCCSEYCLFKSS